MKPVLSSIIALVFCSLAACAWAYMVEEFPLERKVQLSDAVVIGRVVSESKTLDTNPAWEYNTVHVERLLKGSLPEFFDFISRTDIPEDSPNCCEIGKVYLLFVRKLKNNKCESVNGMFGAYKINTQ